MKASIEPRRFAGSSTYYKQCIFSLRDKFVILSVLVQQQSSVKLIALHLN